LYRFVGLLRWFTRYVRVPVSRCVAVDFTAVCGCCGCGWFDFTHYWFTFTVYVGCTRFTLLRFTFVTHFTHTVPVLPVTVVRLRYTFTFGCYDYVLPVVAVTLVARVYVYLHFTFGCLRLPGLRCYHVYVDFTLRFGFGLVVCVVLRLDFGYTVTHVGCCYYAFTFVLARLRFVTHHVWFRVYWLVAHTRCTLIYRCTRSRLRFAPVIYVTFTDLR